MDRSRTRSHRLHFQRFECKYLISESLAVAIRNFVAPFVESDPYARGLPGQQYSISSLYFDTPDLQLYRETIEGIKDRFKLRARIYSNDPDDPVFLEIKKRRNMVIRKRRAPISHRQFVDLVNDGYIDLDSVGAAGRDSVEEFRTKMQLCGARPIVQVGYVREAWIGDTDPEARVTFDRAIRARAADRPVVRLAETDWAVVEGRDVVLELKFNDRCPTWIEALIKHFGLRRRSYSKYSNSVAATRRAMFPPLTGA